MTARIILKDGSCFEATRLDRGPHSVSAEGRFYGRPWRDGAKRKTYYSQPTRRSWPWDEIKTVIEPVGRQR